MIRDVAASGDFRATAVDTTLLEPGDFSLVLGGPLYQLLRRTHLTGDALQLMRRRMVVLTLLAWPPESICLPSPAICAVAPATRSAA